MIYIIVTELLQKNRVKLYTHSYPQLRFENIKYLCKTIIKKQKNKYKVGRLWTHILKIQLN